MKIVKELRKRRGPLDVPTWAYFNPTIDAMAIAMAIKKNRRRK